MSRITLGSNDLLEYNPVYGVLICRECEYAIQKSAVASHLLRHKIYRGERQNLLSSIAQFELREPDGVSLPDPSTRPIAALPVLDGYRCLHDGCHNLCASVKRMKRHWADAHGAVEDFTVMAREVKMQTFFRGTKIRYFEVSQVPLDSTVDEEETTEEEEQLYESDEEFSDAHESEYERASEGVMDKMFFQPTYPPPQPPPIEFDLETLESFHHFLSSTRLTLPSPNMNAQTPCYWQTIILPLAFSRHWLMSGVLAISEYHALMLKDDEEYVKFHRERALQCFTGFTAGREEASRRVRGAVYTPNKEDERRIGGQIMCILRCAHWVLMKPMPGPGYAPFQLKNFIIALRSFSLVERNSAGATPEEVFARASQVFRGTSQSGEFDESEGMVALLDRLDMLPSQMSDVFGRPDNVKDVMATLAAIATLVEHFSASFTPDTRTSTPNSVWHSMVQWLSRVPEHFQCMVSRQDPAALVVVAFWTSALVFRAEKCGYWFLNSLAHKLLGQIAEQLRQTEGAVSLIEGLPCEDLQV